MTLRSLLLALRDEVPGTRQLNPYANGGTGSAAASFAVLWPVGRSNVVGSQLSLQAEGSRLGGPSFSVCLPVPAEFTADGQALV